MNRFLIVFSFLIMICLIPAVAHAHNEWVPSTAVPTYPVVQTPLIPSVTYSTYVVPVNTIRYQWIPVYINKPVTVYNFGLFCRRQHTIYQPQIQWTLQPVHY